jgi:N6-adenosine-specific RNA methylase IME4
MTNYQLLPELLAEDYARLKVDIAERGIMVPVEVDEDGNVLDGHHRMRIAEELGIRCPTIVRRNMAEHDKRIHAVMLNLARRQLTDAQKVLIGEKIEPDIAARALARKAAAGASAAPGKPAEKDVENFPHLSDNSKTRDEVAELVGIGSGRTYENHKQVIAKARDMALQSGAIAKVLDAAERGELDMKDLRKEVRVIERREKAEVIASTPVPELSTLTEFEILYVDPPWRYEGAEAANREIENHYPTMSHSDMLAMELPAADDSVLFMWVTSPKLLEGIQLMAAWGFEYRTCMVWVKDKIGMGYYARQRHELILIGKRGALPVPEPTDRPDSVVSAPRSAHSAKPEVLYEILERMYPGRTKVELFARNPREGWARWGNQA